MDGNRIPEMLENYFLHAAERGDRELAGAACVSKLETCLIKGVRALHATSQITHVREYPGLDFTLAYKVPKHSCHKQAAAATSALISTIDA